jgi:hypothetical protein
MKITKWTLLVLALVAIAAAGCGSDDDTPTAPLPVDTAPPVLPTGLEVSYNARTQELTLLWNENTTDADFAGFLLTRTAFGETVELITTPADETTFVDDLGTVGRAAQYRVYSVDTTGNVSAAAAINFAVDVPEPVGPTLFE